MSRRRIAIVGVLVALVAGGLIWWKLRPGARPAPKAAAPDPWATEDTEGLIAKKRATRGDAPLDARPASLAGFVRRKADGAGVAGAVVTVNRREFGGAIFGSISGDEAIVVVTDATGAWTAPSVRAGAHVVSAAAAELLPASLDVDVEAGAARTGLALLLEAGGATVSGMVDDIGGGPIADARITVRPSGIASLRSAQAYVAITGADGRYRLTLPDGSWNGTAGQADYTEDDQAFVVRGQPVTVDFTLTPGGTIRGQVIARDTNLPVPGARVSAGGGHGGGDDDDFGGRGAATTDAAGNFTLRGVGSGALSLRAIGRGYSTKEPTVVELGIGEEVAGVKVMVDRAYTISGFVVRKGTQGDGIPGVRVGVFSFGDSDPSFALEPSAADGYFEIVGVKPGNYLLAALGEGVMPEIGKPVVVVDRDLTDVLLTMDTGTTLSGRVTPPAVARLTLEMDMSKIGIGNMFDVAKAALVHGESDATGAFTLRSVPQGTFTIVAHAGDGRSGKLAVTVAEADQQGLVVALEDRGAIAGRVVDGGGAAVAGVTVKASGPSAGTTFDLDQSLNESVTGLDGSFRVVGLEPGTIALSVSDEQGPLAWANPTEPEHTVELTGAEEVRGVTLTVEARDGVIRGVVLGVDRQPVADAWVTARSTAAPWRAQLEARRSQRAAAAGDAGTAEAEVTVRVSDGDDGEREGDDDDDDDDDDGPGSGFGDGKTVLTGADGRFTINKLRRGEYVLVAEATKGGVRAQKNGVKTGDVVTLLLEPLGALTVAVTAGGGPVTSYDLECRGPGDTIRRKVEAADGTTVIERRPPGSYRCNASADGGAASGTIQLAGAGRLALALAGWASVTGVVVDEAGQPRAGLRVIASSDNQGMSRAMEQMMTGGGIKTDAAGRFEVGRLAAGKGTLMIFDAAGGFSPLVTEPLTLVAGERLDVGKLTAHTPAAGGG